LIIGVGADIVDIDEFREKLTPELVEELFLPEEIAYASSQARPWENYAVRLAAREAAFKALGAGLSQGLRFRDVEVVRDPRSGSVALRLHGRAGELAAEKKVSATHLSMSHSRRSAIAVVIIEGSE
jgi:holo-[acyl-carrier protein] synthase